MSYNRILGEGKSYYHCLSRTTDRAFVFQGAEEKEVCCKILRKLSTFLGIGVVNYVLMSNHFHLLLEVPDRDQLPPLTEEELLELLPTLYDCVFVDTATLSIASLVSLLPLCHCSLALICQSNWE